jgi:hypothetical protein
MSSRQSLRFVFIVTIVGCSTRDAAQHGTPLPLPVDAPDGTPDSFAVTPDASSYLVDAPEPTDADQPEPPPVTDVIDAHEDVKVPADATTTPDAGPPPLVRAGIWSAGARLLPVELHAEDGATQGALWWHDSKLNARCSFMRAGDNKLRCLPLVGAAAVSPTSFLDSNCTVPLAVFSGGDCPNGYAYKTQTFSTPCGKTAGYTFHALGGELPSTVKPHQKSGTSCLAYEPFSEFRYHNVGAEVPPSTFVAGEWVNVE